MAGILDNKSRIMDVFVTELGRRQIAGTPGGGQLRVEYASFTDGETFYAADVVSGSDDATNRLFFEATNRKQDFITFETDDSGILLGFEEDPSMTILNGNIFLDTPRLGDFSKATYVTGSRFASVSENLMTASLDHFRDLRMIGSLDSGEPINRQFLLDRNKLNFVITNTRPWGFFTAQQRKASARISTLSTAAVGIVLMFDDSPPHFGDAGILLPSIRTNVLPAPSPLKLN